MKPYKIILLSFVSAGIILASCTKDLDTEPLKTESITSATVFDDTTAYVEFLAKLYGSLTLTGQIGGYGDRDIDQPNDEGVTSFMRLYWSMQEISTDEAINAWCDPNLVEIHGHIWSDQNLYIQKLYQRIFINITYCNEYIRVVGKKAGDLSGNLKAEVKQYIAEARFLRALNYYYALDLWGNVPFVTEDNATGAFLPEQIKRADLFSYIESELKDITSELLPPNQDSRYYARANKAAAWILLSRLYLNSEVYLGKGNTKYTECIAFSDSVIHAGYTLHPDYRELFLADNHTCLDEIIFPIAEDGLNTQNYGGVMYIIHASCNGDAGLLDYFGISGGASGGGWNGNRFTSAFTAKFDDVTGNTDQRALFYTTNQSDTVNVVTDFTQGYLSTKFRNITSTGEKGQHADFVDTDFPLFRLADVYLMYAEAVIRGGSGGNLSTALGYINALRERAYGDDSGNISATDLTLNFILDERARELHWEAQRRTDLIRFGLFTGDGYLWDWKGNVMEGVSTDSHLNLLPIPSSDLGLNTNLIQNTGY